DPAERLKKLGELKESGVLSDEEFEAKKAEILKEL
ncbi:MAG: Short C-terminal domain, partial [Solirubrobacteraceae bacterium]|nr:Short C-terminal domain [Solirubrobacteraceae bacterium]